MKSKIFKSYFIVLLFLLNSTKVIFGQGQPGYPDYIPDLAPVPPNVYEFMKYGDVPVSEYTGVPDIRIPIYTIIEGELKIPVQLKYHSRGIKVKEEASWVGLGLSLYFGNITQMVNDRDDFGDFDKILPDPCEKPYSSEFGLRYDYMGDGQQNSCPPSSGEINFYHSYPYFTDYEYPINGDWSPLNNPYLFNGIGWITNPTNPVDSEPDFFKASFFGHDLEFIIEFGTYNIKILNKKTYKILKLNLPNSAIGWKVTDPNGNMYYFEQCDITYLDESWYESYGGSNGIIDDRVENRVWSITKIETFDNREVKFTYFQTQELDNLPSWSQTYHNKIKTSEYEKVLTPGGYWQYKDVVYAGNYSHEGYHSHEAIFRVLNKTAQTISYLSSIEFNQGKLEFEISPRIDCAGTYKLDNILLKQNENIIKTFYFEYDYFIGHENGECYGNAGDTYFENFTQEEIAHRLKLNSFREIGKPPFKFSYFSDNDLPKKTSFAVDYWGYYNGETTNNSLIPNPDRFNLGNDNDNNKSANLTYTLSGTLRRIDYPTGGNTRFFFELNSFNNYWVPDYNNINNTISNGLGLRVTSIEDYSGGNLLKKVDYTYEGGVAITPVDIFTDQYMYNRIKQHGNPGSGQDVWTVYSYQARQASSNNYNLPSPFGTGNYVGYNGVSVIEKDIEDNNGKRILYFINNQDYEPNNLQELIALPTLKHKSHPHNGLLSKEEIYDNNNNLLKETINNYSFEISDKYYGMKTCFYGFLAWANFVGGTGYPAMYIKEQDFGVFYAIYSGESVLDSTIETHWFGDNSISTETTFTYNNRKLLDTEIFMNSKLEIISKTYKYPFNHYGSYMSDLVSLNRVNDVVYFKLSNNGQVIHSLRTDYFQDDDNLIMPSNVFESFDGNPIYHTIVNYNNYDVKGNLIQYKLPHSYNNTILWGYNYSSVVAKIDNAPYSEVISALNCSYEELQEKSTAELLTIFDDLREELPNSFVTSYTHNPLIGLTKLIDINGLQTRYSFDDLERLETVRNHDYRVTKHIDYNYYDPD